MVCKECGGPLDDLSEGATKKFINRGSTEFMCLNCIAKFYKVDKQVLLDKIEYFREQGCTLFLKSK